MKSDRHEFPYNFESEEVVKIGPEGLRAFKALAGGSKSSFFEITGGAWLHDHFEFIIELRGGKFARVYFKAADEGECFSRSSHINICYTGPKVNLQLSDMMNRMAEKLDGYTLLQLLKLAIRLPDSRVRLPYSIIRNPDGRISLQFFLTSTCDWDCCFCSYERRGKPVFIGNTGLLIQQAVEHVKKERKENISYIFISGYDPLNSKLFFDILDSLKGFGIKTVVQTVNSKIGDAGFLAAIESYGDLLCFDIPLYGSTPRTHDCITGVPGSHAYITGAIENRALNVQVHTAIVRKNSKEIVAIHKYCRAHERVLRCSVINQDNGPRSLKAFKDNAVRLSEIVKIARKIYDESELTNFFMNNHVCIPPCVSGIHESGTEMLKRGHTLERDQKTKEHKDCRHRGVCRYGEVCPGIYQGYLELFGDSEFSPPR